MAVLNCPHCKTEVPAPAAAARSNDLACPKCDARLEVASGSRVISSLAGLAAGALAWRLTSGSTGELGGVLPTLYAFLAFGIVSPLVLMLTASLRNAAAMAAPEPAHPASPAGHGAASHGGGHH